MPAACALLIGAAAGVNADEAPDLTVTFERGNGTVAPQHHENRRITVRSTGESEVEVTKGVDPVAKQVLKSAFTPDPVKLKALIDYIRANHLDVPPSPPATPRVQAKPGDGTCVLYVDSRGSGYALPCAGPLPDMIRDIVPASLSQDGKPPARPALVPPVILSGGMPDYATVSLRLDSDFHYELTILRESIAGPIYGPATKQRGRWNYDEAHSLVTLHPDDASTKEGSLAILSSSPLTARLEAPGLSGLELRSQPSGPTVSDPSKPLSNEPRRKGAEIRDIAIETIDGHFLTAADGGGYGGPNDGPAAVALHSDASKAGPWEVFDWIWLDQEHGRFALKTLKGTFVTAVNGGGLGGPNDGRSPFHTDARSLGVDEVYRVEIAENGKATLRTRKGYYVTAVNGGGYGGPNTVPIHTDATAIGPWETFRMVPAR